MIDWPHVDGLRDDMGDAFDEIVEVFLAEVEEGLSQLKSADSSARAAPLHFLKGAALNLGFSEFAKLCAAGELAANEGRGASVELDPIEASFASSRAEFLAGLEKRAA